MIDLNGIKVISVRQPYAHYLVTKGCGPFGRKDIENRTKRTHYRGLLLIHAGLQLADNLTEALSIGYRLSADVPPLAELPRGGIVGMVNLIDCVTESQSPWFFGPFGWVTTDPVQLPLIKCPGQLSMWTPPSPVLEEVSRYLKAAG